MSFKDKIKVLFSGIWDFLAPFMMIFVKESGKVLIGLALRIVKQIASDPSMLGKTGQEKRELAIKQLQDKALEAGLSIGTTVALNMIQAAFTKLFPEKVEL